MTEARPVTVAYLDRAALAYLQRYASSGANLRRVLIRKATKRAGTAPEADTLEAIDKTVAKAERSGLVDDKLYAEAKLASLLRRGVSAGTARAKLVAKGLQRETIAAALDEAAPDEFAQARRYAERRRLGPFRSVLDPARSERDMAVLGRAGFSYRAAAAALEKAED